MRDPKGSSQQAVVSWRIAVRNEANFGRSLEFEVSSVKQNNRGKCAEQSQFPAVPGGTGSEGRGTIVRNKAKLGQNGTSGG